MASAISDWKDIRFAPVARLVDVMERSVLIMASADRGKEAYAAYTMTGAAGSWCLIPVWQ
jgi:hypothetical protein